MVEEFKINLTMIAAFLTLVGYSINDTIVYSPYDHNDAAWAKLPNWIRRRIEARVVEDGGNSQPFDDEIPF